MSEGNGSPLRFETIPFKNVSHHVCILFNRKTPCLIWGHHIVHEFPQPRSWRPIGIFFQKRHAFEYRSTIHSTFEIFSVALSTVFFVMFFSTSGLLLCVRRPLQLQPPQFFLPFLHCHLSYDFRQGQKTLLIWSMWPTV